MRLATRFMGFVAASTLMCGAALACPNDGTSEGCGKTKATMASDTKCSAGHESCMPQMTMMVGDKSYECPMAAGEAAKKEGKSITYKVAGKTYTDKEKAMTAYADVLEDFAAKFATVRTVEECKSACQAHGSCSGEKASCSAEKTAAKSGGCCAGDKAVAKKGDKNDKTTPAMYCVAGQTFSCKEKATEASKVATAAMKDIKVGYRVGSKNFCCDKMAGEAAKKSGEKVTYVVGKDTMECPIQARIQNAKARIEAAMASLNKANDQHKA